MVFRLALCLRVANTLPKACAVVSCIHISFILMAFPKMHCGFSLYSTAALATVAAVVVVVSHCLICDLYVTYFKNRQLS